MATPILNLTEVSASQNQKEVTINAMVEGLEAATQDFTTHDGTSGDVTPSDADFRGYFRHVVENVSTARDFNVPGIKRFFAVTADSGNSADVTVKRGTAEFALSAGDSGVFYCDATTNGLVQIAAGAGSGNVAPGGYFSGSPGSSELMMQYVCAEAYTLPASATGSQGFAGTAATAQTDIDIQKNGVSIGTMRFAASGTTASFVGVSETSFAAGDRLQLVAPGSADATLADISATFLLERA